LQDNGLFRAISFLLVGRRTCVTVCRAAVLVCLTSGAAWSQSDPAESAVKQILLLQSLHRGNLAIDYETNNFRVDIEQRVSAPVNVVQVAVGRSELVGASDQRNIDYIQSIFAGRPGPDLIVAIAGPAAVFARTFRSRLFPEAPLLVAAADERFLRGSPPVENETAVTVLNDFPRLVDDILQVLPRTKHVFMVTGSGPRGQYWHDELKKQVARFDNRLTFTWSQHLSLQEIMRRAATLPNDSAIFYLSLGSDSDGGNYPDERLLRDLRAKANAPLFAPQTVMLGLGIVGGSMMSVEEISRRTNDAAIRLLNGEAPAAVKVTVLGPGPPQFDWRELRRWGIPESRLPPGSVVRFRSPSLWGEYRNTALSLLAVLLVQSLLIVGMIYQRRARQRAEDDSRRSLALAADAGRRATMSALTNSIAHELGQPLSSMIQNAHALQLMVGAHRASPATIDEVLSDIRAQGQRATQIIDRHRSMLRSRQLDKKPIDLHEVIGESLALVAHDLRAREIETTVRLSSRPSVISGDQVLLQQVLVNLLMNAMDAMTHVPAGRRRLTVDTEDRGIEVDVAVRDTGTGLPAEIEQQLFAPFVTNKSQGMGIGLAIVRTIIDAHGGTIHARNNPDFGATFTVTLRRSEAPEMAGAR
jgi:signal transduction histidine kinase/ABC-type uncharacterized transport system substrate-binding protein